jgi:hypothetical protein
MNSGVDFVKILRRSRAREMARNGAGCAGECKKRVLQAEVLSNTFLATVIRVDPSLTHVFVLNSRS